jgi:TonB family protein
MVNSSIPICLTTLIMALPFGADGATSDWLSAPKPEFPSSALKKGSEGSVKLQVILAKDGAVRRTTVLKSSGNPMLDSTAVQAVSKWRMKPSAIKPSDLTHGRETVLEFKQEALLAAVYPDRKAYFKSWEHTNIWMFAPFPAYPLESRRERHTGNVLLKATIGEEGSVANVQVLKSSGHNDLDEVALKAVRLWRAHKQFAGKTYAIPINFVLGGRHY